MKKFMEPEYNLVNLNLNDVIVTSGCSTPPETPEDDCGFNAG